MKRDVPKVFANKVDKKFSNNASYVVTRSDEEIKSGNRFEGGKNIQQKVREIFKSNNYIYKADVTIVMKNETMKKRIIGMKNDYIITMDNELIPLSDITDIYYN